MHTPESPVIIVGAGVAGLTCAVYLKQAGIDALVLEAADGVGGRVRTDRVDGFRLDRGFQILLTAYPEAQRLLNYTALALKPFRSGALIHHAETGSDARWMTLLNPFQEPHKVFQTLASPVGRFNDKLRIVELLRQTQGLPIDELFRQTPVTTLAFLEEFGFSDQIIERFFRPFFGGVFLEDALTTSSNFFEFCFRMFFTGDAAVPARGIGAIADQLADRLSPGQIRLNAPVMALDGNTVRLTNGETRTAPTIVLAVDAAQANLLLGRSASANDPERLFNHTTCTYFAAASSPNHQRLLMLNTNRSSAVHNLAVMSDVAPDYAPAGQTLVSVSTQGLELVSEAALTERIQRELTDWFGNEVQQWRHLQTYHIPHALPAYNPDYAWANTVHQPLKLAEHLYQCGDQTTYPSLNAAMQTGREVAELIRRQ
ncbi:FAD-dependent oxidoreductase [Spirosoma taeanense]|uniref:FAD-dependent oxidoreductase n=1 Tax=Spirosoma taeanense TaxID=2735870 RepID=A0A6M5Y7T9_9BACT|nr:NAD(P)/FAD-dependent oxidoreductase [Spirosoma taeanense]QJW89193.1 FAD-dependent oxidoreductase [Spirosoma taeanense]